MTTTYATDTDTLAAFGAWCARELQVHGGGMDLDGYDGQEKMLELGILTIVLAKESCGAECSCALECGEWPVRCYRFTEPMRVAMQSLSPPDSPQTEQGFSCKV